MIIMFVNTTSWNIWHYMGNGAKEKLNDWTITLVTRVHSGHLEELVSKQWNNRNVQTDLALPFVVTQLLHSNLGKDDLLHAE